MTHKLIVTLFGLLAIAATSAGRAAEKDIFNYKAQHDASAGTPAVSFH